MYIKSIKYRCDNIALVIAILTVALMAIGTVFVFSAAATVTFNATVGTIIKTVQFRNVLFLPVAIAVLYLISCIDYKLFSFEKGVWKSLTTYLLLIAFIMLILVMIPGVGTEVNYARRWLRIPLGFMKLNFQPSEFAKWIAVFFIAAFLAKFANKINSLKCFLFVCIVSAVMFGLIVKEDFGTAAFILLLTFLMLIVGGVKWWYFFIPVPLAVPAIYFAVASSTTRMNRLRAFFDPESFSSTTGYQAQQSLVAIVTGGFSGKGLGMGVSSYGHLPEDTTDFIFAIISHELGFVGAAIIILLYICFVLAGMYLITICRDSFAKLLSVGIILCITAQAAINIGVVTVVLPTKGIPLPFVSAGGTSMLLSAAAVGVLVNIAKQSSAEPSIGDV